MKTSKIIGFIALLLLSLTSCQDEPNFTVKGKYVILEKYKDFGNQKVYLYKMTNPSPSREELMRKSAFKEVSSTTTSKDGEFSFKGYVSPDVPEIYFVGIVRPEVLFFSGFRENIVELFVAEPGEISITLDVPHFNNTVIKGTPINEKLTEIFFYPLYLTDSLRCSYNTLVCNELDSHP